MYTNTIYTTIFILITLALVTAGCSPAAPLPQETPVSALQTQAAQTVIAGFTQNAPLPTATRQSSPLPSETPAFSPTIEESPTPSPSPTSSVPPLPEFDLLLDDDFSGGQGWAEDDSDNFGFGYEDEGYSIYVNLVGAAIWSIRGPQGLTDMRVVTEASRLDGPSDGYYGVICRHQDEDNYYAMVISSGGQYGIARMADGKFTFLVEATDDRNVINRNGNNQIIGECVDERLSLYVNNQEMFSIADNTHPSGSAGIVAGTRLSSGFSALFEYFAILTP